MDEVWIECQVDTIATFGATGENDAAVVPGLQAESCQHQRLITQRQRFILRLVGCFEIRRLHRLLSFEVEQLPFRRRIRLSLNTGWVDKDLLRWVRNTLTNRRVSQNRNSSLSWVDRRINKRSWAAAYVIWSCSCWDLAYFVDCRTLSFIVSMGEQRGPPVF